MVGVYNRMSTDNKRVLYIDDICHVLSGLIKIYKTAAMCGSSHLSPLTSSPVPIFYSNRPDIYYF